METEIKAGAESDAPVRVERSVRRPRTIADEIADYKATPESSKRALRKVVEQLIDLRCPHCGEAVSVTVEC